MRTPFQTFSGALSRAAGLPLIVCAMIAGFVEGPDAGAQTILAVRSADAAPYRDAERAARDALSRADSRMGRSMRTALLSDLPEEWASSDEAPDAIIAIGAEAATALRRCAAADTPLIYCMVADPDGRGLTEDLPHVTGVSTDIAVREQFDLITEALPRTRDIGMLYNPAVPRSVAMRDAAREAMPPGWRLSAVDVRSGESIASAIDRLLERDVDVVWTAPDSSVYDSASIRALLLASLRRKVPVFGFSAPFVRAGALIGLDVDAESQGRRAAEIALEAIERPGRLPAPENADRAFVVNLIVAGRLGINLPARLISRADEIYRE